MSKRTVAIIAAALFAFGVTASYAGSGCCASDKTEPAAAAKAVAACPVTGERAKAVGTCPVSAQKKSAPAKKAPAKAKKVVSAVCPVMGTKIPDVTKAAGKSVYKGKTYYFCCGGCKPQFDKNPKKYVKKAPAKK